MIKTILGTGHNGAITLDDLINLAKIYPEYCSRPIQLYENPEAPPVEAHTKPVKGIILGMTGLLMVAYKE